VDAEIIREHLIAI